MNKIKNVSKIFFVIAVCLLCIHTSTYAQGSVDGDVGLVNSCSARQSVIDQGAGSDMNTVTIAFCDPSYPLDCGDGYCCPKGYPYHCPYLGKCATSYSSDCYTLCRGCPMLKSVQGRQGAEKNVFTLRQFKENRLGMNFTGQLLIGLYYINEAEVSRILDGNPAIKKEFGDIIEEYAPRFESDMLAGKSKATFTKAEIARIEAVMQSIRTEGNSLLKASTAHVLKRMANPLFLLSYGIVVID